MNAVSDPQLLGRYARGGDEAAFGELLRRHLDLVYSAARRLVMDPQLAEDVCQGVFGALAREAAAVAGRLEQGAPLSGWLHLTTRNLAAKTVRTEVRRRQREQEAQAMQSPNESADTTWEQIAPHLDDAMADLSEADRDALLLRFFERRSAKEIGSRLGTSEEAAQKRVSRALERLRAVFVARGLAVPVSGIAGAITAHAVQSAPAGLALAIGASVLGNAGTGITLLQLMTTTKAITLAGTVLVAGLFGVAVFQQRERARLQSELDGLRASKTAEPAAAVPAPGSVNEAPSDELLKLRGEVAQLRRQQAELERLRAENSRLRAAQSNRAASPAAVEPEREAFKQLGIGKMNVAKNWAQVFWLYADANANVLPATFEQASKFYPAAGEPSDGAVASAAADFEIMFSGSLDQISNPSSAILLREKTPFAGNGRPGRYRTYAFVDGHSEIKYAEDGNFEEWEQARVPQFKDAAAGSTVP